MENTQEEKNEQVDPELIRIYEVGFLIIPSVSEADLPSKVSEIKDVISQKGGAFVSEDSPKLINLAYKMSKNVESKKYVYEKAYFGWVKFEAMSQSVLEMKEELDRKDFILRFIITKTVRESTVAPINLTSPRKTDYKKDDSSSEESEEVTKKPIISEEEIDESIDKLVV